MKSSTLPRTDSIEELARFWQTHEVTAFEDQLEEVPEPVFDRAPQVTLILRLAPEKLERLRRIAEIQGVGQDELLEEWVLEKLEGTPTHS